MSTPSTPPRTSTPPVCPGAPKRRKVYFNNLVQTIPYVNPQLPEVQAPTLQVPPVPQEVPDSDVMTIEEVNELFDNLMSALETSVHE